MSKGAQIALGASIIILVLGWYTYDQLEGEGTYRYYQTVTEFREAQAEIGDQPLRLHGYVALESIQRNLEEKHVRFHVQNDPPHGGGTAAGAMPVFYPTLETPDLFKDGAEVVVEGRLRKQGSETILFADNVMAKCPSKFQAMAAEGDAGQPL